MIKGPQSSTKHMPIFGGSDFYLPLHISRDLGTAKRAPRERFEVSLIAPYCRVGLAYALQKLMTLLMCR